MFMYFGNMCNLYPKDGATNLAYTSRPLNLHTDLVFYDETPGVLFLHALEQHRGIGGDTILSDGFKAAEVMRREYPKQFHILSTANAYFTDRGVDSNSETQSGFPYIKLNRGRVINLDSNNDISYIRYSNHLLDSFTDIPVGEVDEFFQAYKLFYNLNMEHSLHFKINDGEMLVADNHRVLHGRETLQGKSSRHLVITYITWDEARCRRRRLQEKFPEILPNLP
uniref:Gamma-butyrobetaine dioxygenase-like n=2 Tax=Hirondellea gigas TaxID=1518452 RepID=A0A6A7FMR9_9CRUS